MHTVRRWAGLTVSLADRDTVVSAFLVCVFYVLFPEKRVSAHVHGAASRPTRSCSQTGPSLLVSAGFPVLRNRASGHVAWMLRETLCSPGPCGPWPAAAGGGGILGWAPDTPFSLAGKPELPRQPGSTAQYDAEAGSLDAEPTESDSPQSGSTDTSHFLHTLDWHGGCGAPPGTVRPRSS